MIFNTIEKIWLEMEQRFSKESICVEKILSQRVDGEWTVEFFIGMVLPKKERFVYFSVDQDQLPSVNDFPETRGFKVERVQFPGFKSPCLLLRLLDSSFKDIFSSLVADLIIHINAAKTQKKQVTIFLDRLHKWRHFMHTYQQAGMSPESQRGLFGELHFMETVLLNKYGPTIIESWTGPEKAHQDFQFHKCAVEVKTCIQKQPQVITIASEKELDFSGYKLLYLYHLSLDQNQVSGETLNEKVYKISNLIESDSAARALFIDKLRLYGYLESQTHFYAKTFYTIRRSDFYLVQGNFPRILETDLRAGVGDVKYGISIDVCSDYLVNESEFHERTQE